MRQGIFMSALFLLTVCSSQLLAESKGKSKSVRGADVASIVAPFIEAGDFMGVVGVQAGDEPASLWAFGDASVELGVANKIDSIFMIGSISKQFTAAAILLLEQDGKLNTGQKVGEYLPGFAHGEGISVEQLLTHTSGVADIYSLDSFGESHGQADDFAAVITEIGAQPLTLEPGSGFSYSNGGYAVLAAIIERVSGTSYSDFLQQRIFAPLGMKDSSDGEPGPVRAGRVSGYDPWGSDQLAPAVPVSYAYLKGSGSLWSTAADLLTWSKALHGGRLLADEQYDKLTTDYGSGYGYGVSIFSRFGRDTIGHDGRVSGFSSDLAWYAEEAMAVVVLGNVQSVARDLIRRQVAAAVFDEKVEAPVPLEYADPPGDIHSYAGAYSFGPGFVVYTELAAGGRLMARANAGGWSELVPLRDGTWFSRMLYARVRFEKDENGKVQRLLWGNGDGAPVGVRTDGSD